MAIEQVKMYEIVDRSVNHSWSVPEFQRGFVWKATQVRDLAESLWFNYPVGSLLVWKSNEKVNSRGTTDAKPVDQWLVDGQQRTTALCILFGRKPYWWTSGDDWNKLQTKYDVRFDVAAKKEPFFLVASAAIRASKSPRYKRLSDLLLLDLSKPEGQEQLRSMAKEIDAAKICDGMDAMAIYSHLDQVRKIREINIVTVTVDHELEDVVEIFSRLNSKGTRVTEADIYLGIVAAKNAGWVKDYFLPFHGELKDFGFDIDPNLLFRSLTGVGIKRVRFKDIDDKFWEPDSVVKAFERTKSAWRKLVVRFREYGIFGNEQMPTEAALVTLVTIVDKFNDDANFALALYWFLQASRLNRYSSSGTSTLEEDLKLIDESATFRDAISRLLTTVDVSKPITKDDFLSDYVDFKFGRFLLYLLVYQNKAQDWDESGQRIGFDGAELLVNFKPQWHHIFPKKHLEKGSIDENLIDALANIAVIGPKINIKISAKEPMKYVTSYKISESKLHQQFIDASFTEVDYAGYEDWLNKRANLLSARSNDFLSTLQKVTAT